MHDEAVVVVDVSRLAPYVASIWSHRLQYSEHTRPCLISLNPINAPHAAVSAPNGRLLLTAESLQPVRTWLLGRGRLAALAYPLETLAEVVHHNALLGHVECPEIRCDQTGPSRAGVLLVMSAIKQDGLGAPDAYTLSLLELLVHNMRA